MRIDFAIPLLIVAFSACGGQPNTSTRPDTLETSNQTEIRHAMPEAETDTASEPDTSQTGHKPDTGHRTPDTSYDFSNPDAVFALDNDLQEISGLTVFDEHHLAAVEDEHGRFYLIDLETGQITAERKFGGKGDYEGIERAGDRLFVLRSDGQLRELFDFDTDDPGDDKHELDLNSQCDAEGLAFQESQNRLLVACKERAAKGLHRMRAIFAIDLESLVMSEDPVYLIRTDAVNEAVGAPGEVLRRLLSPLADLDGFKPSSLAVSPVTSNLFVLSSVLKVIVVLDPSGSVADIVVLDDRLLRQPEGLAFLPNGDLFIASEGAGGDPRLVRFNYRHH